jgi:hypothetical protein
VDENGKATPATFKRYSVTNHINAFPADKALNIPAGSMPSIWTIPSALHASGDQYAVYAGITGTVDHHGTQMGDSNFMQIALIPVVLKDFGKGRESQAAGWMHGRMVDPAISITPQSSGAVNLSVTASATSVPMVYQNAAWADLSPDMQNLWVKCNSDPQSCGEFWHPKCERDGRSK